MCIIHLQIIKKYVYIYIDLNIYTSVDPVHIHYIPASRRRPIASHRRPHAQSEGDAAQDERLALFAHEDERRMSATLRYNRERFLQDERLALFAHERDLRMSA